MEEQRRRTITQRVERPVRLSKYMIAKVEVSITSEIDLTQDENKVLAEDREDIHTLLDFLAADEIENYKEEAEEETE